MLRVVRLHRGSIWNARPLAATQLMSWWSAARAVRAAARRRGHRHRRRTIGAERKKYSDQKCREESHAHHRNWAALDRQWRDIRRQSELL